MRNAIRSIAALVFCAALPLAARAQAPEFVLGVPHDANQFLKFKDSSHSVDAGKVGIVAMTLQLLPNGVSSLGVELSATTDSGATLSFNPKGVPLNGSIVRTSELEVVATNARPGQYQVTITATPKDGSAIINVTYQLLITTAAPDFKSMSAATTMTITITGTQTLIVGMQQVRAALDTGAAFPGSYLIILHNTGADATIAVTSGGSTVTLAPGDVIGAVFSRADNVTATIYDGTSGTLQIGFPGT